MEYEKKYKEALARAKELCDVADTFTLTIHDIITIFPELKESKDDRIVRCLLNYFNHVRYNNGLDLKGTDIDEVIAWLEKQGEPKDKGEISDGYHTFNELYRYRLLYNAAFFNLLPKKLVHKSKKHHDGEECFGGGWFIVMANLPTGQISNHYELKDWDLFQIPEKDVADEWDGHTPQDAANRLHKYLLEKQDEQNSVFTMPPFKAENFYVSKVDGKIHDMTYNPTDKLEPKFHPGDWVVLNGTVAQILDKQKYGFVGLDIDGKDFYCNYGHTDSMRLWTIQDAKAGDVLVYETDEVEWIFIYREIVPAASEVPHDLLRYYFLLEGNNFNWNGVSAMITDDYKLYLKPATKEQQDTLFAKMKEAGYEWDSEKKELKKIEVKTLNADKVIAWLVANICDFEHYVKLFKRDFGL